MVWFLFALLGAFFSASRDAVMKGQLRRADSYVVSSGVFLGASAVLFLVSAVNGFPALGSGFLTYLLAVAAFDLPSYVLFYKALKAADISLVAPMTSFELVFILFLSFAMLGEAPTPLGLVGVLLILAGSFVINTDGRKAGNQDRVVFYVLIYAFIAALTANLNKLLVQSSDAFFGSALLCLLLGSSFLTIALAGRRGAKAAYRKGAHKFLAAGLLMALAIAAVNVAYTMQIVPYVISLKRLSILFSVLYGGFLFKEKQIRRRLAGAALMLAGTGLIIFF